MSAGINSCSAPSELRITDMRFVDIDGAPKRCTSKNHDQSGD